MPSHQERVRRSYTEFTRCELCKSTNIKELQYANLIQPVGYTCLDCGHWMQIDKSLLTTGEVQPQSEDK